MTAIYITIAEAAELTSLHEQTIRRMCDRGEMPHRKFGRVYRIPRSAVEPDGNVSGGAAAPAADHAEGSAAQS